MKEPAIRNKLNLANDVYHKIKFNKKLLLVFLNDDDFVKRFNNYWKIWKIISL